MINFDKIHSEGRVAAWCDDWYVDVVKGCAWTIFALQACMEAIQAEAIESVVSMIDIFVYLTGRFNIIALDHMKVNNIKYQVGHFVFSVGHRVMLTASGTTSEFGLRWRSSVLRDPIFSNQVLHRSINPDEDVGHGAAVQTAIFTVVGSSQVQNLLLPGTTSSSTGLKTIGGFMKKPVGLKRSKW